MDTEDLISEALGLACNRPGFDCSFLESIRDQYEEKGYLTVNQEQALQNILDSLGG